MKRQIVLRSPPVIVSPKQQHLLAEKPAETAGTPRTMMEKEGGGGRERKTTGKRVGEVAGGTAAECTVVCCCCPLAVMSLLVLAIIKVPAGLCRKGKKRRRSKSKKKQQALLGPADSGGSRLELEREVREVVERGKAGNADEAADLEKEMWDRFYGTGFWRSHSGRAAYEHEG